MEALPPPPTCRRRTTTLAALMEELVEEILLRIPPDEPAHHVRAALVCKPWHRILSDPGFLYTATVICAMAGCDHHDCRGGPFLVVYLGADTTDEDDDTVFKVLVYSSETRAWSTPPVLSQLDTPTPYDDLYISRAAVVIGDDIYCVVMPGAKILRYNQVKRCISCFSSPPICSQGPRNSPSSMADAPVLMQNEDGSLGLAWLRDARLYLWSSRMVKRHEGIVAEWVQGRVMELDKILSIDTSSLLTGFAEGVGILFISTSVGTFTFELKSGRVRKISTPIDFHTAFPFISFFTPFQAPDHH